MGKVQQHIAEYMKADNKKYSHILSKIDLDSLPFRQGIVVPDEVWRSSRFVVQVFFGSPIRLSVNRTMIDDKGEWIDGIAWEELQKIKNQCGYTNRAAVELYPPERDVVNVANIRHLFVLDAIPDYQWSSE